ncbi:aldo/keto reductase [Pelagicoccus mobilis]|uniref:Aldo/keto reductase n=1 Tax=Pelagicoccus mobilis TaxID=415221 RepID=A0A934RX53_9BACT|nr:aldo/keto reductase [Pelagicoccus mobilis]MBK1876839.1 aldo/keto reductase [Pelagicoccus mobilis]
MKDFNSTPNTPSLQNISRRTFLGGLSSAALAGIVWPSNLLAARSTTPLSDKFGTLLPTRPLGKSGESVTLLGLGGQHFRWLPDDQVEAAIEKAISGGIRFFDTANSYGNEQLSERLYGKYLIPKYRDVSLIMTKTMAKDTATAQKHFDLSRKNMGTDVIDLWQMHNITSVKDANRRWDEGVVDVFLKAKEEGKVRMIGFTGHHDYRAHLEMLRLFKERGVPLQAVQMPINVVDPSYDSFIKEVIPVAQEMGVGLLAMKTMCGGRLFGGYGERWGKHRDTPSKALVPDVLPFRDATDYVWSLPISTRIAGFDNLDQLQENIDAAQAMRKLTAKQQQTIIETAAQRSGPVTEFYKRDTLPQ